MRILAVSDLRVQDVSLLARTAARIRPDIILYAGDDVLRFGPGKGSWAPVAAIAPLGLAGVVGAEKDGRDLAGIIVAAYGEKAYYLYAGSRDEMRECMPNYGLQWEAIRLCRKAGAIRYDLMGVPPNNNPRHPMAGLYTFKTGLGGELIHYAGCWDYPYDDEGYRELVTAENLG